MKLEDLNEASPQSQLDESYSTVVKLDKLIKSMKLFVKKSETTSQFVNDKLPPVLKKQMISILKQANNIDVADL